MEYYGIKRVGGKGYENKNVIVRRKKRGDYAFFFFLLLFGGVVYLAASALFRSLFSSAVSVNAFLIF